MDSHVEGDSFGLRDFHGPAEATESIFSVAVYAFCGMRNACSFHNVKCQRTKSFFTTTSSFFGPPAVTAFTLIPCLFFKCDFMFVAMQPNYSGLELEYEQGEARSSPFIATYGSLRHVITVVEACRSLSRLWKPADRYYDYGSPKFAIDRTSRMLAACYGS